MNGSANTATRQQARQSERRQVSVLFTDMVGYTAIVERLGEERAVDFTQMIFERLTDAVQANGGVVRSFAGDSIMAVFGIPDALEDAALRACRAAVSIHSAFAAAAAEIETEFGVRPKMRVGVSSGVAVMASVQGEGAELTAVGNTVNLASRIQELAADAGTLICDATRRLVEWRVELDFDGEYDLRGVAKSQKLWRLMSVREGVTRFDVSRARGLSDYVGRDEELAVMSEAFDRVGDGPRVIDLVAEPGLGKTRLVFEFLQHAKAANAIIHTGQCAADAQQVPFHPFIQVVRSSFRIRNVEEPAEVARKIEEGLRASDLYSTENMGLLLNLIGLAPPEGALDGLDGVLIGLHTRDLFAAMLKAQCRKKRVVLQFEDIHWVDNATEESLRRLIKDVNQSNLLVIHTRRPEYEPDWRDAPGVTSLALKPLNKRDITHLARTRLGVGALPDALIQQLTERAGGNPLFGEEILSFLMQQGALWVEDGKAEFDAALGESALPESMQSLLTARIDRLDKQDRALLQAAAAIGRRFDPGVLSLVIDNPEETGASLRRLQAQDIVYRETDSSDYIFKHVLLKESVYQSLLSGRRGELHLAIAQAVERRSHNRLGEVAETLAYHYSLTKRTDLAFTYNDMAGVKSLGVYSLNEANQYFDAAFALYEQDPTCADKEHFAAFLANYAVSLNVSLRVKTMIALADSARATLAQFGDSNHHVHFLHHYVSCLIWNGRYLDAYEVQEELSAMAERLGDADSKAYALVSELAVSCYLGRYTNAHFEAKREEAEAILVGIDDAYLKNFHVAHMGWNEVGRGRVAGAHDAADRMISDGLANNDPRSLGYGMAMKALIAMVANDYEKALAMSEQAQSASRVEFERAIAAASRHAALVPLGKQGAAEEIERHMALCAERGWTLFMAGPDPMLGVAHVMNGRINEGLDHIERAIIRRETEGYHIAANWSRLFLCEIYLEILSGNGGASLGVLVRNIRSLSGVLLFGAKRIVTMLEYVRENSEYDENGHYIGRIEMILGLLYKIKKKNALAKKHLTEARRIISPTGASPILTRIDDALAELA
ncbi:MAG: AAA family ATPase [Sulfitobacter sp.]